MRLLFALMLLAACGGGPEPAPAELGEGAIATVAEDVPVAVTGARALRRMNVDQLSRSIARVTGERWEELDEDGATVDLFEKLSGSLGKPDYLDSTDEDLTPGLLFQKFLGDAAALTCDALVAREAERDGDDRRLAKRSNLDVAPGEDRTDALADLRDAVLLFHGRDLDEGHPELDVWWWLLDEAAVSNSTADAWGVVCVALITHPDFYSF